MQLVMQFPGEVNRLYAGKVLSVTGEVASRDAASQETVSVRFQSLGTASYHPTSSVVARLNRAAWSATQLDRVRPNTTITLICRCGAASGDVIPLNDCEPGF